jgi:GTP1/Obg family GTP-binding protein
MEDLKNEKDIGEETPLSSKIKEDTIHLLRAVIKISSSFNDIDQIIEDKIYFKHRFKLHSREWLKIMEEYTEPVMKSLSEENIDLVTEIYNIIDESTNKVQLKTPQQESLLIFYVKMKSIIRDIEKIKDNRFSFLPTIIKMKTNQVIKEIEREHSFITNISDSEGRGVDFLINFFDELGEKVMHSIN